MDIDLGLWALLPPAPRQAEELLTGNEAEAVVITS